MVHAPDSFEMKIPEIMDCKYLSADEVHSRNINLHRKSLWSKKTEQVCITNLVSLKDGKVLGNTQGHNKESQVSTDIHKPFCESF